MRNDGTGITALGSWPKVYKSKAQLMAQPKLLAAMGERWRPHGGVPTMAGCVGRAVCAIGRRQNGTGEATWREGCQVRDENIGHGFKRRVQ